MLDQVKDASTKAGVLFATIQQNEKQSGELTASIKTANNELLALDASVRKFYGEVDEYRRKITQTSDDAGKLITNSEAAIKKLTEGARSEVDETIEALQKDSTTAIEELTTKVNEATEASAANAKTATADLTDKIDAKLKQDEEAFSTLTSTTKASITTFRTGIEGDLSEALEKLEKSSSELITNTQAKVKDLEENFAKRSEETVEANHKRTEQLIEDLAKLKDQIREQIQQATGFQLFGAFQARQNEIAKSKNFWVYAIGALVVISAGVTIWIAHEAQFYSANNFAFWVNSR